MFRASMKEWGARVVLLVMGFGAAGLVAEVAVRLFVPEADNVLHLDDYYIIDANLGYDIQSNAARRENRIEGLSFEAWGNEVGCFDDPLGDAFVDVLLVGDSFTWGVVPFEDSWGKVVEEALRVRVAKCGVMGYGTHQELLKAKKVITQTNSPKLIVVGYFSNDLGDDWVSPKATVIEGKLVTEQYLADIRSGAIQTNDFTAIAERLENPIQCETSYNIPAALNGLFCWLGNNSKLYVAVKEPAKNILVALKGKDYAGELVSAQHKSFWYQGVLAFLSPDDYPWIRQAWEKEFESIRALRELAEANQAHLLFVLIPWKEQVYPERYRLDSPLLPSGVDMKRAHATLIKFFNEEGISYFDPLPFFTEADLYYHTDGHLNIKGNHLLGALVGTHIRENNMLSVERDLQQF